jgi:hypothetical protein
MATINEVFFEYLTTNLPGDYTGLALIENNNEFLPPYAVTFLVDDPKIKREICPTDQGQSRFQVDTFDDKPKRGIDLRESLQVVCEALTNTTIDGIYIERAEIENVVDRANTVGSLFQLAFEIVLTWQK